MKMMRRLWKSRARRNGGRDDSHAGLTVLELLITIAVIGLICALLLPAVQRARETARQLQCANNLRQIGLACFNHHDAVGRLPPGWNETAQRPNGWGWGARLVEFAELPAVAEITRFDLPVCHPLNDAARRQVLPLFRCPSDHAPDLFWLEEGTEDHPHGAPLFELASANYIGMFGVQIPDEAPAESGNGVFIGNRAFRVEDLRRGASNTLLVGERTGWLLPSTWVGMDLRNEEGPGRIVGCAVKPPNHPEADECEFSSRHTGGAQFLYGDGRVEMISERVSEVVYQRQAGRN